MYCPIAGDVVCGDMGEWGMKLVPRHDRVRASSGHAVHAILVRDRIFLNDLCMF